MRICIDARYVFPKMDGIGRYLINLVDSISQICIKDHDIHFFILEVAEFSQNSVLRNYDNRANITFIKIPVKPQTLGNHFIGKYLKNLNIDLYHYPQFDLPWFLKPNNKIITTIHDLNPQTFPSFFSPPFGFVKKYYSIISNWVALKKSNRILAISSSTRKDLTSLYGRKYFPMIDVVWEGVELVDSSETRIKHMQNYISEWKNKYKIDQYFLYVGNNRPHKNLKNVIEAFAKFLTETGKSIKFVLVGSQLKRDINLTAVINRLGLKEKCIRLDSDDKELDAIYNGAEAFIYCSLSEGFGLPILEAMIRGIPVITSNLSSMKEIAEGKALLVDPNSSDEISDAMNRVTLDRGLRESLIKLGLDYSRELTWKKCAEQTLSVYKKLLND